MIYKNWLVFFFFNDTATTEIYTLSLHDALPIFVDLSTAPVFDGHQLAPRHVDLRAFVFTGEQPVVAPVALTRVAPAGSIDRKSTRLNSSHANISYAVFCLKKKKQNKRPSTHDIT